MNATHALGWALVHFVWQGAAAAVLLGILLALTRPAAARARYGFAVATLVIMLALPVATALRLAGRESTPSGPAAVETPSPAAVDQVSATAPPVAQRSTPDGAVTLRGATSIATETSSAPALQIRGALEPALPWLVALWALGVVACSARLAAGWRAARRLRTDGTRPAQATYRDMLLRLAARLRVSRPVQLLESALVQVPAVIGWLRPVILVPASALTGLTPQQLEVLLAHELAHVRRHDYLVKLVQSVIEALLFYHPAVWWVSRQVRDEREHCCDDLVVAAFGDAHFYASALVGMERLRGAPQLALAATGGSLVHRIRRLAAPRALRPEVFPRWAAGVVAVSVALMSAGGARLAGEPVGDAFAADTVRAAPDTVVRHPDAAQPLAQRWAWAHAQARQMNRRSYWIGYTVRRPAWLEHSIYVDREIDVVGHNITLRGRMLGDFRGFSFRGVRLAPLVGGGDSDDIALVFGFTSDRGGRPALVRVHAASYFLPMDFASRTLFWVGAADDAQSIPAVDGLFAAATPELKEDLVAAVGVHGSSSTVVPILTRWLTSDEATDVRGQAAEWLGFHPDAAAVRALARAARSDRAGDVRREAAEALGDNTLPAATDSLIAVARTADDPDARREAVEGLAQKGDDRALAALQAILVGDQNEDVQREAVETLGDFPGGRGMRAVLDAAKTHPRSDVRREAIETLGQNAAPFDALAELQTIARTDPDPDVAREAVEALGELGGAGRAALIDIARTHPNSDVRREAVETLGESAPNAETARFLAGIARDDRHEDVQREAVETLGELGALGLPAVIEVARTHPQPDVRRAAVETIGERATADQALDLLEQIARGDPSPDVQREAVETLGELRDARAFTLLVTFARTHPVSDVRREAIETLGESGRTDSVRVILSDIAERGDDPDAVREAIETLGELRDKRALDRIAAIARTHASDEVRREAIETYAEAAEPAAAVALLKEILGSDASEDVVSKALESLADLRGGAGIPTLIEVARSHPRRDVRTEAIRRLADSDDPRAQALFEQTLRRP